MKESHTTALGEKCAEMKSARTQLDSLSETMSGVLCQLRERVKEAMSDEVKSYFTGQKTQIEVHCNLSQQYRDFPRPFLCPLPAKNWSGHIILSVLPLFCSTRVFFQFIGNGVRSLPIGKIMQVWYGLGKFRKIMNLINEGN